MHREWLLVKEKGAVLFSRHDDRKWPQKMTKRWLTPISTKTLKREKGSDAFYPQFSFLFFMFL